MQLKIYFGFIWIQWAYDQCYIGKKVVGMEAVNFCRIYGNMKR